MHRHGHIHTHSARLSRLTSRTHVDKGVVDQDQFIEVELIGKPLAFGLMEDPLVVVVSGKENRKDMINKIDKKKGFAPSLEGKCKKSNNN